MKRLLLGALCAAVLLTGCSAKQEGDSSNPGSDSSQSAAPSKDGSSSQETGYDRRPAISRPEIGADVVIDPPYDFDPDTMVPADFGDYFTQDYPTQVSTYLLGEGTDIENEVTVLKGRRTAPRCISWPAFTGTRSRAG